MERLDLPKGKNQHLSHGENLVNEQDDKVIARLASLASEYRDLNVENSLRHLKRKRYKGQNRKRAKEILIRISSVAAVLLLGVFLFFKWNERPSGYIVAKAPEVKTSPDEYVLSDSLAGDYALTLRIAGKKSLSIKGGERDTVELGSLLAALSSDCDLSPKEATFIVPPTRQAVARLSDGTLLTIDSDSEITLPAFFREGEARRVSLDKGQAFFSVAHEENRPFVVSTAGMALTVLGTEFNVNAYPEKSDATATLVSGRVRVTGDNGTSLMLEKKGAQALADSKKGTLKDGTLSEKELRRLTAWRSGVIDFERTPLRDIMSYLGHRYDIETKYEDEAQASYSLTGALRRDFELNYALEVLARATGFRFEYDPGLKQVRVRK